MPSPIFYPLTTLPRGLLLAPNRLAMDLSHRHRTCGLNAAQLEQRITRAKRTCQQQGGRFTALREQVFRLILQSPTPIGAYELLAQLQAMSDKPLAPPTVYRSLDFLLQQGFIHQLSSSKAFFPCCQPDDNHTAVFLVCQRCKDVEEFADFATQSLLADVEASTKFAVQASVIELLGLCQRCQALANAF